MLQRYASFSKDVSVIERHPSSVSGIEVKSKEAPDPGRNERQRKDDSQSVK